MAHDRMLQNAMLLFVLTILAAFVGFGGVLPTGPELAKAIAVGCLVLFFVTLYRVLCAPVIDPRALHQARQVDAPVERSEGA